MVVLKIDSLQSTIIIIIQNEITIHRLSALERLARAKFLVENSVYLIINLGPYYFEFSNIVFFQKHWHYPKITSNQHFMCAMNSMVTINLIIINTYFIFRRNLITSFHYNILKYFRYIYFTLFRHNLLFNNIH